MKKSLLSSIVFIAFAVIAYGQKMDASKVPEAVKASFAKLHPGMTPKWEKENGKYEALFKLNGNAASATFDANGKLEEGEENIKVSDLPATIQKYLTDHYKGKKIKEAAKITLPDGTLQYEAEVDGKGLIFDASGKFLKETKE